MAPPDAVLSRVLDSLDSLLKAPESFIAPDATLGVSISAKVKHLYDYVKTNETQKEASSDALPELIVEGFDDEQVWQELELQNAHIIDFLIGEASRCIVKGGQGFETATSVVANDLGDQPEAVNDGAVAREAASDSSSTENSEGSREDDNDEDADDPGDPTAADVKPSVVDDQFFKLAEMEKFLEQEDARFEKEKKVEEESDEEDEDDEDSDDEAADYMYDEFFTFKRAAGKSDKKGVHWKDLEGSENDDLSVASDEEADDDEIGDRDAMMKKVQDLLAESGDDENDDVDDGEAVSKKTDTKSSFEKRMEKQKKKIAELEESSLADKPWQLLGEVSANQRPENSLLEEAVDFDVTTAPAPLVTQETTMKLEDLILQRIKDKAFDDVERKQKDVKDVAEYKKRVILDQEKSKQSLSQIYEQEYLNKMASQEGEQEPKEDPKHAEINKMMTALFAKLDALSNFNFTPRPAMPDIKIVSNMPALTMEEATPVTATEASMLAPEEIRKPVAHLQSKAERSDTDRKRERRRKKARGHAKRLAKLASENEKLAAGAAQAAEGKAGSASLAKLESKRALAVLSKAQKGGSNVTVLKEQKVPGSSNKAFKSSAKFFQQLQEQTAIHVKKKRPAELAKPKEKHSVKKLKL